MSDKTKKKRSKARKKRTKVMLLLGGLALAALLLWMGVLHWVLLGVLALVLLVLILLLLILFVPIRYRLKASLDGGQQAEAIVSWFLHLLSFRLSYAGEGVRWRLNLAGGSLMTSETSKKKAAGKKKKAKTESAEADPTKNSTESNSTLPKEKKEKDKTEKASVLDTIRQYWELIRENPTAPQKALAAVTRCLVQLVPKRCDLWMRFGLEDPAMTGELYGIYWSIYPMLMTGNRRCRRLIASADFEKKVLQLNGWAKGSFTIAGLLWPVLRLVLDPEIRKLLRDRKKQTL